jgi:hypothetical protein
MVIITQWNFTFAQAVVFQCSIVVSLTCTVEAMSNKKRKKTLAVID